MSEERTICDFGLFYDHCGSTTPKLTQATKRKFGASGGYVSYLSSQIIIVTSRTWAGSKAERSLT